MNILDKANLNIKSKYPFKNDINNFCTIHESENLFQINFESIGCRNSYQGKCIMCDYGRGRNINKEELKTAIKFAFSSIKGNPNVLLVNTYGSILDDFEFCEENLIELLKEVKHSKFKIIIFETFYKTITQEKIDLIKKYINDKLIYFEIGIESFNDRYRRYCLNKEIDNKELFEVVKLVKRNDCFITGNLLIGIPFLTTKEQLDDAIESINIAFENNIDEVTLFPINIKKYTLLYELYEKNIYKPISLWMLIEILNNVKTEYLDKITFAWFGNRDMVYSNNTTVFPKACKKCKNILNEYFENASKYNAIENKQKILEIKNKSNNCDCRNQFLEELNYNENKLFQDRIEKIYKYLEKII